MTTWTCPDCGRAFARQRQPHTCSKRSVEDHLEGVEPDVAALFAEIQKSVAALGPASVIPVKSAIDFRGQTTFLAVKVRSDHLMAELALPRRLEGERFQRVTTLSPASFEHSVRLTKVEDLDDEFRAWLAEAYGLGAGMSRRRDA